MQDLELLSSKYDSLKSENFRLSKELAYSMAERDKMACELQSLNHYRETSKVLESMCEDKYKVKLSAAEAELRKKTQQLEVQQSKSLQQELQITALIDEKEDISNQVRKLKQRRYRRVDYGGKVCINCKRDYKDDENFNWSCRTHYSQWSGEMWWCCGKTHKEALGCKFAKHVPLKDDEDEDAANGGAHMDNYLQRCQCCKELGHTIE